MMLEGSSCRSARYFGREARTYEDDVGDKEEKGDDGVSLINTQLERHLHTSD
jgi:hypothetical protein